MEQRKSFPFFRSFFEGARCLSKADRLAFYDAIIEYGLNDIEPTLKGSVQGFFEMAKPSLEKSRKLWENGCKGAEHGVKGGAPKGNQNARKQPETTPRQPQDNGKTTPKENKNKKENKKENKNKKENLSIQDRESVNEVIKKFNLICKGMPKVRVTNGREQMILDFLAEIEECKKMDKDLQFTTIFLIASNSPYLNGNNDKGWTADFNWIIKNWVRIYERTYDND